MPSRIHRLSDTPCGHARTRGGEIGRLEPLTITSRSHTPSPKESCLILGGLERRGFDAEADLDLVHQDLDPAAEFIDPFGLARCGGFRAIKPAQKFVEAGQVGALFI